MILNSKQKLSIAIPENLAQILEQEIVMGALKSEERLTEEDVAERYGVSRSPVREALRLLEHDGLVIREARKGIWVAPMNLRDFDEVYTCRIALEGLVAREAAASNNIEGKQRFKDILNEMRAAVERNDVRDFFSADVRGSFLVYEIAGNRTLTRLLRGLEKQALRYRFHAYQRDPSLVTLSLDDSDRICQAIMGGDADQARGLTENLIREIWQRMRSDVYDSFGA